MDDGKVKIEQFPQPAKSILANGERVELIPTKDGVRVIRVRREEIKSQKIIDISADL